MYEEDSALNNLQWLICHKTQPNQTNEINSLITKELTEVIDLGWFDFFV